MGHLDRDLVLIDVARYHRLGQAVARRSGVPHHSPQVILLRDGVAPWDADHRAVTAEAVAEALRRLGEAAEPGCG